MSDAPQYIFRDGEGWFDVLRTGEFPNTRDGRRVLQLIAAEDLAGMVAQWEAEGRPEFLVDSDHFSYERTHDTRALGWGTGLRVDGGVLQARARWSAAGQEDVESGAYRFCSASVHSRDESGQPENAGGPGGAPIRTRPFRLDSIALTNRPNIPGLRPLTNRAAAPVPPPVSVSDSVSVILTNSQPAPQPKTNRMDHKAIAALLGLPDTATDAEITHAATVLTNRARSAEEAAADADMARFAAVIPDVSRPYWRGQLISNRAAALPVLESMLPLVSAASASSSASPATAGGFQPSPLHNRGDAAAPLSSPPPPGSGPAGGGSQPLTEADRMARQNSAIALVLNRNRGLSRADAFDIARTEQPGLFQ